MLFSKKSIFVSVTLLSCLFFFSFEGYGQNFDGKRIFFQSKHSKKNLTYVNAGSGNGYKNIVQTTPKWDDDELFVFNKINSSGNKYHIKNVKNGLYLHVDAAQNNTVILRAKDGSAAQVWQIDKKYKGYVSLRSMAVPEFMRIRVANRTDGADVQVAPYRHRNNYHFEVIDESFILTDPNLPPDFTTGTFQIEVSHSKKVLEIYNGSSTDKANVQQFRNHNSGNQKFQFESAGGKYHYIKNVKSGKYLDVARGKAIAGTNVWQFHKNSTDAQKWYFKYHGAGYFMIISKLGVKENLVLDIERSSMDDNANLLLYSRTGNHNQLFLLRKAGIYPVGNFPLRNEDNEKGKIVEVHGSPESWLINIGKGWMGYLPDFKTLKSMSIPGTHNSGTSGTAPGAARNQAWTIEEQLNAGIRYLDLRCAPVSDSEVMIVHGDFGTGGLTLKKVFEVTSRFLNNNPSETVMISIKNSTDSKKVPKEHRANDDKIAWANWYSNWENIIQEFGSKIYTPDRTVGYYNPHLGQLRGKIYLTGPDCKRLYPEFDEQNIIDNIPTLEKTGQNCYKVHQVTTFKECPDITVKKKKEAIRDYIDLGNIEFYMPKWIITELNGSAPSAPIDCANDFNNEFYKHSKNKRHRLGLVIMDYPGEKLVYRIIKSNFL